MTAATLLKHRVRRAAVIASLLAPTAARSQTWTPTTSLSNNWSCIACSADGVTLVAAGGYFSHDGYIWTSTDFGRAWTTYASPQVVWGSVACSADASRLIAQADVGAGIYCSTNRGSTWSLTGAPQRDWSAVAASADGSRLIAGSKEACFRSDDSGSTWTAALTNIDFSGSLIGGIASSADGSTVVVVSEYQTTSAGSMYLSSDGGRTASPVVVGTQAQFSFWAGVACSADARTIIACAPFYGIYVSTNGGASWAQTNFIMVNAVASSADGTRLAAADELGTILTSTNAGVSWSSASPAGFGVEWTGIASSADGCRLAAAAHDIWVWQTTPQPVLNISGCGTNLLVSWIVPSMPFVLQECSDLQKADWADVATTPSLNYTNIHYEVSLPRPQNNRFFRLLSR